MSMLAEFWSAIGVPIFMLNHGAIYCAGNIPSWMSMEQFLCIFSALFIEIGCSITSSMYFRRNTIVFHGRVNRFTNLKMVLFLQLMCAMTVVAIFYLLQRVQISRQDAANELLWLLPHSKVIFMTFNRFAIVLVIVVFFWATTINLLALKLLVESLYEVKHGMKNASRSTRAHQRRAIITLLVQATIPTITYLVPIAIILILLAYSTIVGNKSHYESKTIATISATACTMFSLHTIAHSKTVVATNSSYRRRIPNCFRYLTKTIRRSSTIKESSGNNVIVFDMKTVK